MLNNIADQVKAIIVDKLNIEQSQCTRDAKFDKDLGADSLDIVELIMEFEKHFDVTISDADAEKITTVGNAITYMEKRITV